MISDKQAFRKRLLIVGSVVFAILLIDQLIKIYVKSTYDYGDSKPLLGNWLVVEYIENHGMAFGTSFGTKAWHKYALSIFRIIAIGALCYYWVRQAKAKMRMEFLIALGLIVAGATGNLIDSMFYDFAFKYDPCFPGNHLEGSGIIADCNFPWEIETKPKGFLLGNVVDMFRFNANWPTWMPWVGGQQVFPAIWNLADGAISIGVVMIFLRQRKYFPKTKKENKEASTEEIITQTEQTDASVN